jgi:hypothetical protein
VSQHFLTLIEYGTIELHPLIIKNSWLLSSKEVAIALNIPLSELIKSLKTLTDGKHYSYESINYANNNASSSILFFSKSGIIRLAYSLKSDDALKFLEFIEDINLRENENKEEDKIDNLYDEIEDLLRERLDKIKKNPNTSLEEINHFILTLDNLVKKQKNTPANRESGSSSISDILQTVVNLAQSYTQKPKN